MHWNRKICVGSSLDRKIKCLNPPIRCMRSHFIGLQFLDHQVGVNVVHSMSFWWLGYQILVIGPELLKNLFLLVVTSVFTKSRLESRMRPGSGGLLIRKGYRKVLEIRYNDSQLICKEKKLLTGTNDLAYSWGVISVLPATNCSR